MRSGLCAKLLGPVAAGVVGLIAFAAAPAAAAPDCPGSREVRTLLENQGVLESVIVQDENSITEGERAGPRCC